jgi:hypothetical protein
MARMPQAAFLAVTQYLSETAGTRFVHLRRIDLPQEAYDLLALSTAAVCLQRQAIVRLALRLLLTYAQREEQYQSVLNMRDLRRQDRALQAVTTLRPHDPATVRVLQLVREHLVMAATVAAILRAHPSLLPEVARTRQRVELELADLESSSSDESSASEYAP